jgi:hypothetical protein
MLYAQIRLNAAAKAPKPVRMNFLLLIETPPYLVILFDLAVCR